MMKSFEPNTTQENEDKIKHKVTVSPKLMELLYIIYLIYGGKESFHRQTMK